MEEKSVLQESEDASSKSRNYSATISKKGQSKGKGAKDRREQKFRERKNNEFQMELQASILRRLKIADPTNVNALHLQSSIVPASQGTNIFCRPSSLR